MKAKNALGKQIAAILLILAGLIFGVFGVLSAVASPGMDPYEARNGIVLVSATAQDSLGNTEGGIGTGWAIGKPGEPVEYIVTNGHVVEAAYVYPRMDNTITGVVQVYFSAAENDFVQAKVLYYSGADEKDLAILQLPSPTDKRTALALRASDSVNVGDTAYALGYPGNATINEDFSTYDKNDITMTKGIISKRTTLSSTTYEAFQMDVSIASGNSGGPLVDDNGYVVGVNVATAYDVVTGQLSDVHYAIVMDELTKILDAEQIEYTMANPSLGWVRTWMCFVFFPLAVLLIAGGALLLVFSLKSAKASAAGAGGTGPAPSRGQGPVSKHAVLRGVTGKYAGQSFDLLQRKIVIGRDPSTCNIIFDRNTPGISGRHCQVAYDPNADCFLLTDLGSSYGTFLGNGKKLTANVAEKLLAGDTFYLCDNANRFVVTKE